MGVLVDEETHPTNISPLTTEEETKKHVLMERSKTHSTKRWKKDKEGAEAQRKKERRRGKQKKTIRNAGTTVVHRRRRKTWGGLSRSLRHSSAFVLRDLAKTSSSIRRDSRDDEEDEGEEADKQFLRHLREGQLKAQQQCKEKENPLFCCDNKITRAEERRRRWKEEEANKENELKGSAGLYQMLRRGYLLSLQHQPPQTKCSKREDKSPPGQLEEVTTNQKEKERPKEEVGDEKEIKTCSIMTYNTVLPIRCNLRRHSLSELEDAEDRKRKRKQRMMAEAVTYCNRISDELYQRAGGRLYILSFECHNQDDERLCCDFIKPQQQHDVQEPEEEQEEEEEGRRGFVVRVRWALPVDLGGDTSQAESLAEWLQAHVPPEDPSLVESRMGVFHEVDLCQYQARMRALCERHPLLLPPTTHGEDSSRKT